MKRKRHGFLTEAQLVERTRDWLQFDGWTCYFEVAPWGSGAARADIVATRGPLLTIVECKLSLSLALLEQCHTWRKYAHITWAATPTGHRNALATEIASLLGFGVVEIGSDKYEMAARVRMTPSLRRRVDHGVIRRHLGQAQAQTKPGSSAFATPYTATCDRLRGLVRDAGGRVAVKDAMKTLQHHYSSDSSARSTLIKRVECNEISGLTLHRDGKAIFFAEATRA